MPHDTRFALRAEIALLGTGRLLDHFSLLFTLVAASGLTLHAYGALSGTPLLNALLFIALLAGVLEKYLALRVAYDAALFAALLEEDAGIRELDAALQQQFGLQPRPGHDLARRLAGARRLLKRQLWYVITQLGCVLCALLMGIRVF